MTDDSFERKRTKKFRRPAPNAATPSVPQEEPFISGAPLAESLPRGEDPLESRKTGVFRRRVPGRDDEK